MPSKKMSSTRTLFSKLLSEQSAKALDLYNEQFISLFENLKTAKIN